MSKSDLCNSFSSFDSPETVPAHALGCCCVNMNQKTFFQFVNMFDMIFLPITIIFADNITKVNSGIVLLFALISFITFQVTDNYGTIAQKIYAITKIISSICQLLFLIFLLVILILFMIEDGINNFKTVADFMLLGELILLLPVSILSVQWSFLLRIIVQNKSNAEISQNNPLPVQENSDCSYETYTDNQFSNHSSG